MATMAPLRERNTPAEPFTKGDGNRKEGLDPMRSPGSARVQPRRADPHEFPLETTSAT